MTELLVTAEATAQVTGMGWALMGLIGTAIAAIIGLFGKC